MNQNKSIANAYLVTIEELTPKANATEEVTYESPLPFQVPAQVIIFGPLLFFFVIFVSAFLVQIVGRAKDARKLVTAMVIALLFATTPFAVHRLYQGTDQEIRATPDERPRNVRIYVNAEKKYVVDWHTDTPQYGGIRVKKQKDAASKGDFVVADSGEKRTDHSVIFPNNGDTGIVEVEVLSGTMWYSDPSGRLLFTINQIY